LTNRVQKGRLNMSSARSNIFNLGSDWADPILWYARGVKAMKSRPLSDPTSWTFYAAMHGIARWTWDYYGYTKSTDADPSQALKDTYWDQCQHQSWYFLPWHRGYLVALENQIRAEIEKLGGPHAQWALPYWNYFGSNQNFLPPAFQVADWPDGHGDNPLFVERRWGPLSTNTPFEVSKVTHLNEMNDAIFTGIAGGGQVGFGGPKTGFSWSGRVNGGIEHNPHNFIHGLVGGSNAARKFPVTAPPSLRGQSELGVMSSTVTAALDPIFYLHHCNIDRLWESWNIFPLGKPAQNLSNWKNPTDGQWLNGPASIGERIFSMPKPDKSQWVYTSKEMESITNLGYKYDDLTPGAVLALQVTMGTRARRLGIAPSSVTLEGARMTDNAKTELMGASEGGLSLSGAAVRQVSVKTSQDVRQRVTRSLLGEMAQPDRIFLNLENITGLEDSTIFQVYIGLKEGAEPSQNIDYLAGGVSLFGVTQASDPAGKHAGNGINTTMEITDIVDKLHLEGTFNVDTFSVQIVPFDSIPESAKVKIGRISLYRQFE
jgi:tyrosinase